MIKTIAEFSIFLFITIYADYILFKFRSGDILKLNESAKKLFYLQGIKLYLIKVI